GNTSRRYKGQELRLALVARAELWRGVDVDTLFFVEQLLLVVVVLQVLEAGWWPLGDTDTRFAQRTAERHRLAVLEQEAGRQRAGLEHELLLGRYALAAGLLARRQAGTRRDELADDDVLLQAEQ